MTARVAGSFRDPAGHVFERDGVLYRFISPRGRADYDQLISSGLYDALASNGRLIPHTELGERADLAPGGLILQPVPLRLVTYPYEWAFSALRDAALLTLSIAAEAVRRGMRLKDASVFNVQFDGCRPVFIDTLSFEPNRPGPWPAYYQFCGHFLAPLALMATRDEQLGKLLRIFPDGVPLRLASSLMPRRTWLRPGLLTHLHLHAQAERRLTSRAPTAAAASGPDPLRLLDSLEAVVRSLSWTPHGGWTAYDEIRESYSAGALQHKEAVVAEWLGRCSPATVWDLGANTGRFSRLAASHADFVVALDADAGCIERMYLRARDEGTGSLLPLVFDVATPSPAIGWANRERATLQARGRADLLIALAVVHHIALARGIPLPHIAGVFAEFGERLIVEYVPKSDAMSQRLLAHREDVFADYTQQGFEAAFTRYFSIVERVPLRESERTLYLMTKR